MKLLGEHDAQRIHGTLSVTLADGREAALDIDIDVSDPRCFLDIRNHYDEREFTGLGNLRPVVLLSQSLEIHWPTPPYPLRESERPAPLTIRVPQ